MLPGFFPKTPSRSFRKIGLVRGVIRFSASLAHKSAEIVAGPGPAQRRFRRSQEGGKGVLFSDLDMDVLRLVAWCQYLPPEELNGLCTETEQRNLLGAGLIKLHRKSGSLILTGKGAAFLQEHFGPHIPGTPSSYREGIICRRLRLSRIVLTAYRAGIHVFTQRPEDLMEDGSLFLPAITRGRGRNPWGNTRMAAIAHLGEQACGIHYVEPGIGKILLTDELTAFSNNIAFLKGYPLRLVFAGTSYAEILAELESSPEASSERLITYGEAYSQLHLPVHLLSCDRTGALQLQIMAQPDYRQRLARAALKAQYHPPPMEVPEWDALFRGRPFVVAADMDLKRLDAAIAAATAHGHEQIALAALEEQVKAVFLHRYRNKGLAQVFTLTEGALAELGCGTGNLRPSGRRPFWTEKGDVVHAPLIQAGGKAGKSSTKPVRKMVSEK